LKDQGIFNNIRNEYIQCITIITKVDLKCIQLTNGISDHIANLKIKADYIILKVGKIYTEKIIHVIWNKILVVKMKKQLTVFVNFNPNYNVNYILKVKITNIDINKNVKV
jgi:hypothetical protein